MDDGSIKFEPPIEDHDYGNLDLHLGWIKQPDNSGEVHRVCE